MDVVSVLVVSIVTFVALLSAVYAYGMSNLQEIKDNWVQYRCNPLYMPLANLVGSDVATNFTNCTLQSVNTYAGFVMDPIYQNFKIITDIINTILGSMNDLRALVTGASEGFLMIIKSTFGKIQNSMSSVLQIVGRVRTIISRMITTFAILMNIITTGMQTGESVANGPIGKAAEFFCFNPHTKIEIEGGLKLPMYCLQAGMKLSNGKIIRSVIHFSGAGTDMYQLGEIFVSGNHKVRYNKKWIRVETHPHAKKSIKCGTLYCLNVEDHVIPIDSYEFLDYEETDNPEILREFFKEAEKQHGTRRNPERYQNPLENRYTGVRYYTKILMDDGRLVRADNIRIGDTLAQNNVVIGIIEHCLKDYVVYDGIAFAPGTSLVFDDGLHSLTSDRKRSSTSIKFIQFITMLGTYHMCHEDRLYKILDDQETTDDDVHTRRDIEIQKEQS